jgi:nicotinamidase-related amidase
MNLREKYFTEENFREEVSAILDDIRKSGGRHRPVDLSGAYPALLVTDMQQYFLSPESHAFIPSAETIIPNINRLISHFLIKNYPVIFTKHINDEENAGNMKTWWQDMITPNSPSSSLSPLLLLSSSLILKKPQYDAFYQTNLEQLLKDAGIDTLIICGVMTNLCCETTLRSAFMRGFNAIMPVDTTAAYRREYHISTFINLSFGFCPLFTTDDIISFTGK